MNERIKELRKSLGLTQQQFADKLGIARGNIAAYEVGKNAVSNAVISLVCKEFDVNEVWLRTGEGGIDNMFIQVSNDDEYSLALGKLTVEENELVKNAVKYLANAEPDKLRAIEDFMKSCLGLK